MKIERLTAEEMLNQHPYLRVWIENSDDSEIRVCDIEQAIWLAEAFAAQEVEAEIKKLMPSNEQINTAAKEWAREHSNAPDKDCPEWILQDYEAGACFVRQCFGCLNKVENERQYDIDFGGHLKAGIKIKGETIEIVGAMNGWGVAIPDEKIIVTEFRSRMEGNK